LQSNAYVHSREQSEKALTNAFGDEWRKVIRITDIANQSNGMAVAAAGDHHVMLGSGCVAQVLEGQIGGKPVAIKIVHPGVRESIEADIKLLKFLSWLIESIVPGARDSFALSDCTEEFASLMTSQLDLNIEANNLDMFRAHFSSPHQWRKARVTFPQPVRPYVSRDVLIETFEAGRLISDLLQEEAIVTLADVAAINVTAESAKRITRDAAADPPGERVGIANDAALHKELRKELATEVLNTLLKMVFEDNFVHAG
jgi:predicted unusual protein kinase regulating ubiquinone biosynthesis (AarF/ABC1/UbiB family)